MFLPLRLVRRERVLCGDPPPDLPGPLPARERDPGRAGASRRQDHSHAPGAQGELARAKLERSGAGFSINIVHLISFFFSPQTTSGRRRVDAGDVAPAPSVSQDQNEDPSPKSEGQRPSEVKRRGKERNIEWTLCMASPPPLRKEILLQLHIVKKEFRTLCLLRFKSVFLFFSSRKGKILF